MGREARCRSKATVALGLMVWSRPSGLLSAAWRMRAMVCSGVSLGLRLRSLAARLATLGLAMEVPENFILVPPGTKLSTWKPLASRRTVGP